MKQTKKVSNHVAEINITKISDDEINFRDINFRTKELRYLLTLVKTQKRNRTYRKGNYSSDYVEVSNKFDDELIVKLDKAVEYHTQEYFKKYNLIKDGETIDEASDRFYLETQERIQKEI